MDFITIGTSVFWDQIMKFFYFQALNVKVVEDIEMLKEEARLLSEQLGDRFLNVFHEKLGQIEVECQQVRRAQN